MSAADGTANGPGPLRTSRLALFTNAASQMSPGERAAFEGILTGLRPSLAIEIGSAEGGSLERIAAHSDEVHSLDLVEPDEPARSLENAHLHTGDSHERCPRYLPSSPARGATPTSYTSMATTAPRASSATSTTCSPHLP